MKTKNTVSKAIANIALANAKHAANSTCFAFFGQKKMPDNVKKLRKF